MVRLGAILLISILIIGCTSAFDANIWKKCGDTAFCRRHRELEQQQNPQYVAIREKMSMNDKTGAFSIVIKNVISSQEFKLQLTPYNKKVLRIELEELNTERMQYKVSHVRQ